ncbi:hypothetical protein NVS55_32910 [Myxococcus stipitatus]|uniref:hypothetical protein n=1 Tax=Myxococcus stipitatus TaxID=83455 RepID=UPI0031454819
MRRLSTLTALMCLLMARVTLAAEGMEAQRRVSPDLARLSPFGLMLDAGLTGGMGLSFSFRPTSLVRLHVGGTHNGVRPGGRVGLTLLPLRGPLTPALSLDVGHARPVKARSLERRLADLSLPPLPSLERVGYTYASAMLGLELHLHDRVTWFVRGGVSFLELSGPGLKDLPEPFRTTLAPGEEEPWKLRMVRPTAKLGFILSFG